MSQAFKLVGIPDSALATVLNDLKLDGSRLITKYRENGTWTLLVAPPGSSGAGDGMGGDGIGDGGTGVTGTTGDPGSVTPGTDSGKIAWGARTDALHGPAFKQRTIEISKELGIDPSHLMAVMAFETGRSFSPSQAHMGGGSARGLIQFMPDTAAGLGTSSAALVLMSAVEQLEFVKAYFKQFSKPKQSLADVYMTVLYPKAIGQLSSYVLYSVGSNEYEWNKGLDVNDDGKVTKAEAAHKAELALVEGMRVENLG